MIGDRDIAEVAGFTISAPASSDEAGWRRNWAIYLTRYDVEVTPETTDMIWHRMLDPLSPTMALIARDAAGNGIGFCHMILHENTWSVEPVCYLEDMFVIPEMRRRGVARALLERLVALSREKGWNRVYWMARSANAPARALYDQVTGGADAMVRYTIRLGRPGRIRNTSDIG